MPYKLKAVAWHLHTFTSIVQNEASHKNVLPNESGVLLDSIYMCIYYNDYSEHERKNLKQVRNVF